MGATLATAGTCRDYVAVYVNTGGAPMPVWDGHGDWNLPWTQWTSGGSVPTS